MDNALKFECFSVPVIAYNADSIICGENNLTTQLVGGVSYIGKPLADFLGALPETHTTHILFKQGSLTVIELTTIPDAGRRANGAMLIEHELITPLERIRSKLYKLTLTPDEQKFFEEIFLSIRKKVQSIAFEMNFREGNVPLFITADCNLSRTLTNLATAVNQHYNHEIVSLELQSPHIFADCDENKFLHALLHLISNAVKMTAPDELPVITLSLSQNEKETKITVSDQGVGFPKGNLELLTEAYQQADNSFTKSVPGLGVGLYLVKKIVSMHQGILELRNNENGGALVTITLPLKMKSENDHMLGSPMPQFSLEEIKERAAFLLVDALLKK